MKEKKGIKDLKLDIDKTISFYNTPSMVIELQKEAKKLTQHLIERISIEGVDLSEKTKLYIETLKDFVEEFKKASITDTLENSVCFLNALKKLRNSL